MSSKHKSAVKRITASIERLAEHSEIVFVDRVSALNQLRRNLDEIEDRIKFHPEEYGDDGCGDDHDQDIEDDRRDFLSRQ